MAATKKVTPVVGQRRLLKLAAFLDKVKRSRFYFGSWVGGDWKGAPDLSCGTTACALGWAASMPEFRRLGLRIRFDDSIANEKWREHEVVLGQLPGYHAAARLFGLTVSEATFLFIPRECRPFRFTSDRPSNPEVDLVSPGEDATPRQVATHIRRFVKRWQREGA